MSTAATESGVVMDVGNAPRIRGRVRATLPKKGFFWIDGDDEVKYFAHAVQVQNGWNLMDLFEGQGCEFTPRNTDKRGPHAERIRMDEPR